MYCIYFYKVYVFVYLRIFPSQMSYCVDSRYFFLCPQVTVTMVTLQVTMTLQPPQAYAVRVTGHLMAL